MFGALAFAAFAFGQPTAGAPLPLPPVAEDGVANYLPLSMMFVSRR